MYRAIPCESRSISEGKNKLLLPPSRISTWPVCCEVEVTLDSYFRPTQVQGFDQGNRLVGADLGDCDEVGLVAVHESPFVHRDSMLQASLGTHSGGSICESKLTLITTAVSLSAGETEVVVGD